MVEGGFRDKILFYLAELFMIIIRTSILCYFLSDFIYNIEGITIT